MKKKSIVITAVAAVFVLSAGCLTAFAAESEAFGYLIGRQRSASRNELYARAEELPEEEQDAFLAENGIGETPYSEEAAAAYGYVTGQQVGSIYEDDAEDKTDYSYATGQEVGASYAPETEDGSSYSYLAGQQDSASRNVLYAQAEELPEEEQNAFLAENGIDETPYSEEAAAAYSYVTGQQVGSLYEDDTEDKTGYSYTTGQEVGASCAPETEDGSSYSYLAGQQDSAARNELYAQAEELPEEEQDAFLAENGIGETPYSEEAAAAYSYVGGQQRGASYRRGDDDGTWDMSGYSYQTGQQRGSSYHN